MEFQYKKRAKGKDKAKRNEQYTGKISARHVRITVETLKRKDEKTKVATRP